MEADKTVIGFKRIQEIDLKNAESNFTDALLDVAREQAEISFKVGKQLALETQDQIYLEGKQAGMKEVVEWILKAMAFTNSENLPPNTIRVDFKYDDWQAKLKEWGIE